MQTEPNLEVNIGGMKMKNPVTVASGTFGYGPEYSDLVDLDRLGAITVKGICQEPHDGNPPPRTFETSSGLINAIGLPGPGVEGFIAEHLPFLKDCETSLIVNIWGRTPAEYARVAERLDREEGVDALEINVSCPNVKKGGALYGTDRNLFEQVVTSVREATDKAVIPKLAPNVSDIGSFARSAEECGCDGISVMNSYPALAIDIETRKPELANLVGGLSGPAIHPIAVCLVWQVARAVNIPVIGMGGVYSARDALELIIAGASAVAIGTANFSDPQTSNHVLNGIRDYLIRHEIDSIAELSGTMEF